MTMERLEGFVLTSLVALPVAACLGTLASTRVAAVEILAAWAIMVVFGAVGFAVAWRAERLDPMKRMSWAIGSKLLRSALVVGVCLVLVVANAVALLPFSMALMGAYVCFLVYEVSGLVADARPVPVAAVARVKRGR